MARNRFDELWSSIWFSYQPDEREEDVGRQLKE